MKLKKYLLGILTAVLVLSCLTFTINAADVKTIQVTGFEDSSVQLTTYADPKSSIKVTYETDIVQEGKQAVKFEGWTDSWSGVVLQLDGPQADWTGMTTFKMWVYGASSKKCFDFQLEDKNSELFMVNIKDDFTGWKQVVFKLSDIKSRPDYQDPKAKLTGKIVYPLKDIQFCCPNSVRGGSGQLKLYFDDFEVTNE